MTVGIFLRQHPVGVFLHLSRFANRRVFCRFLISGQLEQRLHKWWVRICEEIHLMKSYLVVMLIALILVVPVTAQSTAEIDKIRAQVQTLATGKDSQVQVKFRDQTKIKGYIESVEPLSFKLRDAKDGTSQSITYAEVQSVSKASGGVSTKTWLILGGVAAGAVTTWLIVKPAVCDGGAQTRGIC